MDIFYRSGHENCEQQVLNELSSRVPHKLLERFSTLERSSGEADEHTAVDYICERLCSFGVDHQVFEPSLLISLPIESVLEYRTEAGWKSVNCSCPSFSASTDPQWLQAEGVLARTKARSGGSLFDKTVLESGVAVSGKIALVEAAFAPALVQSLARLGAVGVGMINPGQYIHESSCSTIWGAPSLENMEQLPKIPVISINHPDGERFLEMLGRSKLYLRIRTKMKTGWVRCMLPVAEIKGVDEPEKFILIHGHIDSWYFGLCDNAAGNAVLLELARVLHQARGQLGRSIRIAWWPGHSHGRYAGSTWYADNFAVDIEENCIAHLNIDMPGMKHATSYEQVMWMDEMTDLCHQAIYDVTGQTASGIRPPRAGDYSFNNIGLSGAFMLLSAIPVNVQKDKGLSEGGHLIFWHTDLDMMEYIDLDVLMTDIKIYAVTACRLANSLLLPLDFRPTLTAQQRQLEMYQRAGQTSFDLAPALSAASDLMDELNTFYRAAAAARTSVGSQSTSEMKNFNNLILVLARGLIPIDYVNRARFDHDPAVPVAPLGRLESVLTLAELGDSFLKHATLTSLLRGRNQIVSTYRGLARQFQAAQQGIDKAL